MGQTKQQLAYDPFNDRRLLEEIELGYEQDPLTRIVLAKPADHAKYFAMKDGIIWTRDRVAREVMCVPWEKQLITKLVTTAHELLGHYGSQRTEEYLRRYYW